MPRRRCVGCGRVAPKPELLRIATLRRPGASALAVCDPRGALPGRGAYLCRQDPTADARAAEPLPARECLRTALRRGAIARTLRSSVPLDPKLVESVGR